MKQYILLLFAFAVFGCKEKQSDHSIKQKEMTQQSGYAPVNGISMYYEIHGEGSPLVLVHGGGSTIQTSFGHILPVLAKTRKVIAVELQAHGHTSDRDAPESFEQDADDVAALLMYLKVDKADLLGFSNGGSTVMQVAIRHPQLVNKLIVIAGLSKREGLIKGFFEGMENASINDMPALLKDAFMVINNDSAKLLNMFNKDKQRMMSFKDWKDEDLASIKAPSLLIVGDRDVVTTEHTLQMSRLIPGARLLVVPGSHGDYIGEEAMEVKKTNMPGYVVSIVEDFLNGI